MIITPCTKKIIGLYIPYRLPQPYQGSGDPQCTAAVLRDVGELKASQADGFSLKKFGNFKI